MGTRGTQSASSSGLGDARGCPPAQARRSCAIECPAGDKDTATAERRRRLDQRTWVQAPQVGDQPPGPCLTFRQPGPWREPSIRPCGPGTRPSQRTRHRPDCLRCSSGAADHICAAAETPVGGAGRLCSRRAAGQRRSARACSAARHPVSMARSAASSLVSRLKRPHLHACNASDQRRHKMPGGGSRMLDEAPRCPGNQRGKLTLIPRYQAPHLAAHADAPPASNGRRVPGSRRGRWALPDLLLRHHAREDQRHGPPCCP